MESQRMQLFEIDFFFFFSLSKILWEFIKVGACIESLLIFITE